MRDSPFVDDPKEWRDYGKSMDAVFSGGDGKQNGRLYNWWESLRR